MLVSIGHWVVWGWVTVAEASPSPQCCPTLPDDVQVARRQSGEGIDGFVRTHQEALAARRVRACSGDALPDRQASLGALMALLSAIRSAPPDSWNPSSGCWPHPPTRSPGCENPARVLRGEREPVAHRPTSERHKNTVVYRVAKAEELARARPRGPPSRTGGRSAPRRRGRRPPEAAAQSERGAVALARATKRHRG